MLGKTRIACAALMILPVLGCQNPQTVLNTLPDPSAAVHGTAAPTPLPDLHTPYTRLVVPPVAQPFRPAGIAQPTALAQPGWVPAGGISNRWTCLVIHHSASDRASPQAMDHAHRQRGWDELGYHFVIGNGIGYPDGQIYVGTRWTNQKHGAHCKVPGNYYNDHGVGICLMGNFEEHPPTERQMHSLTQLIQFLENQCGFGQAQILTHGGITGKTRCPGRYFSLNDLYRRLAPPMYARK